MRRFIAAAAFVSTAALLAGCGQSGPHTYGVEGAAVRPIVLSRQLPPAVLDLKVTKENVSTPLRQATHLYVDQLSVYGLRSGKLLQATLQISHLSSAVKRVTTTFKASYVLGIGASQPRKVRIETQQVFEVSANGQQLDVWFVGRLAYVLAVRKDFALPRTLLRQMVDLTT